MLGKYLKFQIKLFLLQSVVAAAVLLTMSALIPLLTAGFPGETADIFAQACLVIIFFVAVVGFFYAVPIGFLHLDLDTATSNTPYLMNTLPIKPKTKLISNIIFQYINSVFGILVFLICTCLVLKTFEPFSAVADLFKWMFAPGKNIYQVISIISGNILVGFLPFAFVSLYTLFAVLPWRFGVNKFSQGIFISGVLAFVVAEWLLILTVFFAPFAETTDSIDASRSFAAGFVILAAVEVVLGVLFFVFTERIMRKSINLV
jgi:hypothetical protein